MNDSVGMMMKQLTKLVDSLKNTQKQVDVLLADKSKLLNKRLMTQNLTGKLTLQAGEIIATITDTNYTDTYEWNAIFEEWIFKEAVYTTYAQQTNRENPILTIGETILDQLCDVNVQDEPQQDECHAS